MVSNLPLQQNNILEKKGHCTHEIHLMIVKSQLKKQKLLFLHVTNVETKTLCGFGTTLSNCANWSFL
jgi:hypothetical protein